MTALEGFLTGALSGAASHRLEALGWSLTATYDDAGNYRPELLVRGPHGVEFMVTVTQTRDPDV